MRDDVLAGRRFDESPSRRGGASGAAAYLRSRELALLVDDSSAEAVEELVADRARRRGRLAGADIDVLDPNARSAAVHAAAADLAAEVVGIIADVLIPAAPTMNRGFSARSGTACRSEHVESPSLQGNVRTVTSYRLVFACSC